MNMTVVNKEICVKQIRVIGVAASSVFLIGDTKVITSSTVFDTPPEAVLTGPLVPLSPTR
ncbi:MULTISPECIES: spore gernimation protein GerPD [unclassified Paenibacillus]|uniref:spore gernimation protein GerPD n=1 Tax=unclassified Paenibacillus TaxID=185978 RepID=UPI001C127CDA|nr:MULTISPECIES: spore gernimation protein GerPD [unclassified Paenibacillus]MBU5443525.1 spore gernimation protein GerPD [Paenibacillus sp. MSJ-34]CAH0120568.1 putative spore germination protein GerPD [Paenibacillus sp. CECT 9249]